MIDRLISLFEPMPRTAEGWLARLGRERVSSRDLAVFETWLEAAPDNLSDYEALKGLARDTGELKAAFTAELAAIPAGRRRGRRAARWRTVAVPAFGALAALVLAVAIAPAWLARVDPMRDAVTHATRVGEIRDVTLADGSRITLDTATRLRVAVEGDRRRIALDQGQAYFAVAHDAGRPFEVAVADRAVVVTGTRFTATLRDGAGRVALLEGGVSLMSRGGPGGDLALRPGEAVTFRAGAAPRREARFDPAAAAAWRERRLVFRDQPLSRVLADLSRYTPVRITAADPALARMRVTAVFPLDGDQAVVDRIDQLLPVSVVESGPDRVEVRAE